MIRRAALVGLVSALLGCADDPPETILSPMPTTIPPKTTTTGTGGAPPCEGAPPADAVAPPGWHALSDLPDDCRLFVPDDLSVVEPVPWSDCDFMPAGCRVATAPWAEKAFWGFGPSITISGWGRDVYVAIHRSLGDSWFAGNGYWNESVVLRNEETLRVIGADAGTEGPAPRSRCLANGLATGGTATTLVVRSGASNCPIVFHEPLNEVGLDSLGARVDFGREWTPGGRVWRDGEWLVLDQLGPPMSFYAVNTETGARCRSIPIIELYGSDPGEFTTSIRDVGVHKGVVHFAGDSATLGSGWISAPCGIPYPLLRDKNYSYEGFTGDGRHFAWIRAEGPPSAVSPFSKFELWTAPFTGDPKAFAPRKLRDLPDLQSFLTDFVSVGDGHIAVRHHGGKDVRIYGIEDGSERRLPEIEGQSWVPGPKGLVLHEGSVWVLASKGSPSNDIRFIYRFERDALPKVDAPTR